MSSTCSEKAAARLRAVSDENNTAVGVEPDDSNGIGFIVLGVLLGLFASIGISIGINLQDYGKEELDVQATTCFSKTPMEDRYGNKIYKTRFTRKGYIGLALFVFWSIVNFVAFAFAPASILAPLEGAQFVANFAFNMYIEDPNFYDSSKNIKGRNVFRVSFGTALICTGIFFAVFYSPKQVAEFDEEAIECFWNRWVWWVCLIIMGVAFFASAVFYRFLYSQKKESLLREKISFSIFIALAGAFMVTNAKAISELVSLLISGENIFDGLVFWVSFALLVVFLLIWIIGQNVGVTRYKALTMLPLLQGFYIIFSSISAGIFFEEFTKFNGMQTLMYIVGLLGIGVGLYFTTLPEDPENKTSSSFIHSSNFDVQVSPIVDYAYVPVSSQLDSSLPGLFLLNRPHA